MVLSLKFSIDILVGSSYMEIYWGLLLCCVSPVSDVMCRITLGSSHIFDVFIFTGCRGMT